MKRAALVAGAALAGYAGWVEPRRLILRESRLELPHWPAALNGVRVGVMTDLHAGAPHAGPRAVERWVTRMNEVAPDVVLLGGDFADAHFLFGGRMDPEAIAERLARLTAPLGSVAVVGKHDRLPFGGGVWTPPAAGGVSRG